MLCRFSCLRGSDGKVSIFLRISVIVVGCESFYCAETGVTFLSFLILRTALAYYAAFP